MRPGRPARSGMVADRRRGADLAADLMVVRTGLSGVHPDGIHFIVPRFVHILALGLCSPACVSPYAPGDQILGNAAASAYVWLMGALRPPARLA